LNKGAKNLRTKNGREKGLGFGGFHESTGEAIKCRRQILHVGAFNPDSGPPAGREIVKSMRNII